MKRFLGSRVCLCVIVLFSLCGMAVLLERAREAPSSIPGLTLCGEMVCYFGILPGTTAWDEGMDVVRGASSLKASGLSDTLFLSAAPGYSIGLSATLRGLADPNDGVVEEIKINIDEINIDAGYVIQNFGTPCYVLSMNGGLDLGYPNAVFGVVADLHRLTPDSPVRYILLRSSRAGRGCPEKEFTGPYGTYQWHGFRRYF